MGGEISKPMEGHDLAITGWHPAVGAHATLYAGERNCDSTGAQATHSQADRGISLRCNTPNNEGDMPMPTIDIDGIATHYESSGSGPPILMMAPGGF